MKLKEIPKSWCFFGLMVLLYLIVYLINSSVIITSLLFSWKIFQSIVPMLFVIFIIMAIVNRTFDSKMFRGYLLSRKKRTWVIAIIAGILSTGPIYMWYPLLNELQKKGARPGFIATFLYNRAIKIPMLPMIIFYFGFTYTIVLSIVMIIFSIINGLIVEKILEVKK